jgi:hypothetical protein
MQSAARQDTQQGSPTMSGASSTRLWFGRLQVIRRSARLDYAPGKCAYSKPRMS